jgi:hypothetical protein
VDESSRNPMQSLKDNGHPAASIHCDTSNQHCFSIPSNHIPGGITDEIGGGDLLRPVDGSNVNNQIQTKQLTFVFRAL